MADAKFREDLLSDARIDERVETPRLWRVLLHNDDYTTQEFVVWVLEIGVPEAAAEAFAIMMHVHQSGLGVAGLYTRDVAETKVNRPRNVWPSSTNSRCSSPWSQSLKEPRA